MMMISTKNWWWQNTLLT